MGFRRRIQCFGGTKLLVLLFAAVAFAGCNNRPGDHAVSSICEWSEASIPSLNLENRADRSHLRYDAITAEDMAIRWSDKYVGPRSGKFKGFPEYGRRQNECMEALFHGVASYHGLDVALVRQYRLRRDIVSDSAVILGFAILYAVVAYYLAGVFRRRFPSDERVAFLIMMSAMSLLLSIVGVMAGDLWSLSMENLIMGSGHLSYRVDRVPWRQHWGLLFLCGLGVFWLAAVFRCRVGIKDNSRPTLPGSSLRLLK